MTGSLHDLATLENQRWNSTRKSSSAPASPRVPAPIDPRQPFPSRAGRWRAYVPLGSPAPSGQDDPLTDFTFVEAAAVASAVIVSFTWRPEQDRTTYLMVIPFDDDRVDLDGGAVEILQHILFRVVHQPRWIDATTRIASDLRLVAPAPCTESQR